MAYFGKEYSHEKDENFDGFVASLGISEEKAKQILKSKSVQKIVKLDSGEYILSINTSDKGKIELKFKDGVEFDENVAEGVVAKSTFKVDGNVITQVQKFPDGKSITIKREYTDDKMIVTLTLSSWDGSARRYYAQI